MSVFNSMLALRAGLCMLVTWSSTVGPGGQGRGSTIVTYWSPIALPCLLGARSVGDLPVLWPHLT